MFRHVELTYLLLIIRMLGLHWSHDLHDLHDWKRNHGTILSSYHSFIRLHTFSVRFVTTCDTILTKIYHESHHGSLSFFTMDSHVLSPSLTLCWDISRISCSAEFVCDYGNNSTRIGTIDSRLSYKKAIGLAVTLSIGISRRAFKPIIRTDYSALCIYSRSWQENTVILFIINLYMIDIHFINLNH